MAIRLRICNGTGQRRPDPLIRRSVRRQFHPTVCRVRSVVRDGPGGAIPSTGPGSVVVAPHRNLELRPPRGPTVIPAATGRELVHRTRVHGLINEYSRHAA